MREANVQQPLSGLVGVIADDALEPVLTRTPLGVLMLAFRSARRFGVGCTYMERASWLAVFPTAAISLTVLAYNFLGAGLRDVLDPRLKGST